MSSKKKHGQFYTTNSFYILDKLQLPFDRISCIIEPFAGKGDLIKWIQKTEFSGKIIAYDIEPKLSNIKKRDTLLDPPDYKEKWIITNPPYLARNKSKDKTIYDLYNTNDLYKAFLYSINDCEGGIVLIPAGFFFSSRKIDVKCRDNFMRKFRIKMIKYFEEQVFIDTTTTIVAVLFEKSNKELTSQVVEWRKMPSGQIGYFTMNVKDNWIIAGEIYNLPQPKNIIIRRYVIGQKLKPEEQLTNMTLTAVDSGRNNGSRISLEYKKNYVYQAKECSRSYATLCINGLLLSEEEQIQICENFNNFIEEYREKYWSLWLPQFRESKEYARKRIPFELVYNIVGFIIMNLFLT